MALKDITLGQYFPGNSPVHRLDPRTKLIAVVLYIVALFLANWFVTYAIMFLVLAGAIAISKVPPKSILRGLKPILFIVAFTAVLNIFYTPGSTVLAHFWIFTITLEGVWRAFFMVVRIMMLISGTFLLTYTTSPILLTDGLGGEQSLSRLGLALLTAVVMALGTALGGRPIVEKVGSQLSSLSPAGGLAADLGAGVVLLVCSALGLPASTTHAKVSAICGAGRGTDRRVMAQMAGAWILTFPACGGMAFLLTKVMMG